MRRTALGLVFLTLVSCAGEDTVQAPDGGPGGPGAPGSPDSGFGQIMSPAQVGDAGGTIIIGDGGLTVGDVNGCVGTKTSAPPSSQPKVDIVWLVDASGSMLDEQARVGKNLTQFANAITQANIDVSIVMMTTSAAIPVICPVTNPDPLAGTALAMDPRYHFLNTRVDSTNLLDLAVSEYPKYQQFLRPGSTVHYVFVTDDESSYKRLPSTDARAQQFRTDLTAVLGRPATLHTISSPGPSACRDPMCMPDATTGICVFVMLGCGASAPGLTYYALANQTKGLTASICQSDWTNIFNEFQAAVIASAPLPCDYTIPPPPAGDKLDPMRVNVGFTPAGTSTDEIFPKATDLAGCADKSGWYYDNDAAPTRVLLCPASCSRVAVGGNMNIAFGCGTVVLN